MDRLTWWNVAVTQDVVLVAECHGQRERVGIDASELARMLRLGPVQLGSAFVPPHPVCDVCGRAAALREEQSGALLCPWCLEGFQAKDPRMLLKLLRPASGLQPAEMEQPMSAKNKAKQDAEQAHPSELDAARERACQATIALSKAAAAWVAAAVSGTDAQREDAARAVYEQAVTECCAAGDELQRLRGGP